MSNYLITGGAGFIGSNFLNACVKKYKDDNYICLDALTYAANLNSLKTIKNCDNFKFIHGNICDKRLVEEIFSTQKIDYVINFAAESHVDNSIKNPSVFIESNVVGTQVLLDASKKFGIKRFHQVSTDEVYGSGEVGAKEDAALNPSSPYAASKASADLLVLSYKKTFDLPITISRSCNNYGKYQHCEKFIPHMIMLADENKPLTVYGDGSNKRNYLHVDDNVRAIDLIVRKGATGEVYNVGSTDRYSNIDVAKTILKFMDKNQDSISYVKDRAGHDYVYTMDDTKIKTQLDFRLETDFYDGLVQTINWYLSNKNQWSIK